MMTAWVALGSNVGDRRAWLQLAREQLARHTVLERCSADYETRPVGPSTRPFLNAVCRVRTSLSPLALLERCHAIEAMAGREREVVWGPRTLDLDLLYGVVDGEVVRQHDGLVLPHPRCRDRDFVLVPWIEIEPERRFALTDGRPAERLVDALAAIPVHARTVLGPVQQSAPGRAEGVSE